MTVEASESPDSVTEIGLPGEGVATAKSAKWNGFEFINAAGNDAAFIITTGFDVVIFHFMLKLFTEVWDRVPIPRADVDMDGVRFFGSKHEVIEYFSGLIVYRRLGLAGVFCLIDGVKIPVAESLDEDTQTRSLYLDSCTDASWVDKMR
ncbi:hypothetical protein GN244_ATG04165 [Phytophthora infestans]|uniref:Uncharacterized protein n=1 Tax=Phytophthora infestans TaxID=4787 RepID=A0A833T799_PHYIN|nr:hypothetical protein GN244_ATG04165 [Phytophthora infestans]KAF4149429.1 hypothetical protein GN958_ATG01401 [Phytophthora infestans]